MNELYVEALNHTLASTVSNEKRSVKFTNDLPIGIIICEYSEDGDYTQYETIEPKKSTDEKELDTGTNFVVLSVGSGAFCCAVDLEKEKGVTSTINVTIDAKRLPKPNAIGPFPEPDTLMAKPEDDMKALIPSDGDRVLVGVGTIPKQNGKDPVIIREQFWKRGSDSYVLAPGEKRTISVTHTSGREETSSSMTTVSMAISAAANASWGVVSASISASLSASSTSMQQVTVRSEETRYESCVIKNVDRDGKPRDRPCMYLHWQLVDIVTIFFKAPLPGQEGEVEEDGAADKLAVDQIASIEQTLRPIIVAGPYFLSNPRRSEA